MKQLYLKPCMTVFCITEDVLTKSEGRQLSYIDGEGDGDSVSFVIGTII